MKQFIGHFVISLVLVVGFFASTENASADYVSGSVNVSGPGYNVGVGMGNGTNMGSGVLGGGGAYGSRVWLQNPFGLPQGSLIGIVGVIVFWLLAIFGFLGVIGFIIAGIMYLLSAGDDKQAGTAKAALKFSIIGVIVALLGFIIIQAATMLLTGQSSAF